MIVRIEPVSDGDRLALVYREVLDPSFPVTELVTFEEFVASGGAGRLDVLVAMDDDDAVLGAIIGERHGAGVLVNWLAVAGTTRGGGVGGALLRAGIAHWLGEGGALVVLGEVERPDIFSAHPQYGDPARRVAFYERAGVAVLDMPYYQPPIREGAPRIPGLMLTVLAAAKAAATPRLLDPAETAAVRDVLLATMGPAEPGDAETARVYDAVDNPHGLRLLPLAEYESVPLSR